MESMNIEKFVEDLDAEPLSSNPPPMPQQQQPPHQQPPQQQQSFIKAPPTPMEMLARWRDWDAKQQQILRQSQNIGNCQRAVFNPTYVFHPTTAPQLAPIADPDGLQTQIDTIVSQFSGVSFAEEDIAYRKNFLVTIESKTANLMSRTMQKCAIYHRQTLEYNSLKEYDAEIERLRNEQKMAVSLIGGCIGNKTGDVKGGGRETRKTTRGKRRRFMSFEDEEAIETSQDS